MIGIKKSPAEQAPVDTGPRVSELLKTTRERLGEDLQTVSQVLRIRFVYLEAIEAGRYQDLPGKTYVVGFVRAYAEHLGLDVEEVVNRFKQEVDGLEAKEEFVFPSPVTEQSVPGGAIILISLIILGAAYGGWYFLSSQDRNMAELVPDLPAKFAEMINKVKDSKTDEKASVPTKTEETAKEMAAAVEEKVEETVSEANTQDMAEQARKAVEKAEAEAQQVEEKVEQVVETVKVEAVEKVEEQAVGATEKVVEEEKTIVEKVKDAIKTEEKKEETVVETVEEKVEEVVAAVTPAAAPASTSAVEDEKKEEAETPAVVEEKKEEAPAKPAVMSEKILLKAVDYAWIQVVDGNGSVKHTQVLNEGDEYEVPAEHGLVLRTGNAGGLEVTVDGKKAPSLGSSGEVRRKIMLSPEKLLAGNAVER